MKQIIRVFPDYCSSGLWDEHGNLDERDFESVLSASQLLALKYWHQIWEASMGSYGLSCSYSKLWQDKWEADGKALVTSFNECQDIYEFVYIGDNF